jgi:hypothetical protein
LNIGLGVTLKKVRNGKYEYKGLEIINHGYYSPERCVWWEAVNVETGCADYHAHSKREIKRLIDADTPNEKVSGGR